MTERSVPNLNEDNVTSGFRLKRAIWTFISA